MQSLDEWPKREKLGFYDREEDSQHIDTYIWEDWTKKGAQQMQVGEELLGMFEPSGPSSTASGATAQPSATNQDVEMSIGDPQDASGMATVTEQGEGGQPASSVEESSSDERERFGDATAGRKGA